MGAADQVEVVPCRVAPLGRRKAALYVRRKAAHHLLTDINTSKAVTSTNVHSAQVMALLRDR